MTDDLKKVRNIEPSEEIKLSDLSEYAQSTYKIPFVGKNILIFECFKSTFVRLNKNLTLEDATLTLKFLSQDSNDNKTAQKLLATCYTSGSNGVPKDYAKATELFKKTALKGDGESAQMLGALFCEGGHGIEKDDKESFYWSEKASMMGNKEATFDIAVCYSTGRGVEQNDEMAFKNFKKAATLIHSDSPSYLVAHFNVAVCYSGGIGVEQNNKLAAESCEIPARLKYEPAMRRLGIFYFTGTGVKKDITKATAYLFAAAVQKPNDYIVGDLADMAKMYRERDIKISFKEALSITKPFEKMILLDLDTAYQVNAKQDLSIT